MTTNRIKFGPLRVGIGGPVGAGKTSLTEALCHAFKHDISMAVITNDIYTQETLIIWCEPKRCRQIASEALKQAVVLIPLFAKMRQLT